MSLIDCLTKHGITDETVHDHILGISKKYQKQGMAERDAHIRAVRDIQEQTLDSLHSVYNQLGIKGYRIKYEPNKNLSGDYSDIEKRFGKDLNTNYEQRKEEYLKKFGNVINTDNARELSPDYEKNRGELSSAVHEPASSFVKEVYKDLLKKKPESNKVVFTSGGTGAGKTSGINNIPAVKNLVEHADAVYDSNMNGLKSATSKIDEALKSGRDAIIIYTYRHLEEAFEKGVIPRMQRMGRSVPIEEHIKTHEGSLKTLPELMEHYKGNDKVSFINIDNSLGKDKAQLASLEDLQKKAYFSNDLKNKLYESADEKRSNGSITEEQHRGLTIGRNNEGGSSQDERTGGGQIFRPGDSSQSQHAGESRQEQLNTDTPVHSTPELDSKTDELIKKGEIPNGHLEQWLKEESDKINNNGPDETSVDANAASEHSNDIRADASREKGTTTSESLLQGDAVRSEHEPTELGSDKRLTGEERKIPETSSEEVALMGATIPYVNEFIKEDVAPVLEKTKLSFKDLVRTFVNTLSPKTGVSEKAITHLMKALGGRTEAMAEIDKTIGGFQKAFDRMKDEDRIDFIDRFKKGQEQQTPELQEIANMISGLDKQLYDHIAEYKPTLAWKENHFRVLWKVVPGAKSEKLWSNLTRRPFQGSKGFMKQSTLADMSEGISKGGEPASTNPIKMFKLSYGDGMKYVTAQRMFEGLKSDKMVQFVKFGDKTPEGFVPIDDRIAKVYYPTPEGLVNKGEYYIEEGAGRLLNNHLSADKIRESKFGAGLMEIKNLYTATELGLSGFHAIAEGLETVSSEIGLGLRQMINLGIRGDFKSAAEGLKDIVTSFKAPVTTFSSGRKGIRFATEQGFENSKFGQEFLKKVPDAKQYIHDYFTGGGIMNQHEDYKLKTIDALKEQAGKNNYIGAALRALPAMNEMILNPLFETYIPALKFGMFMKEFPVTLKENEQRLLKGQTTREELARKSVGFIEDRLGEMNFDGLFFNRTFKTTTQFFMRSVTWKLGNLRGMLGAPVEQGMEFINAAKEKRAPILMPKMAWLFGLAGMQVVLATVIQKLTSGKDLESFKDIVAPQINAEDDKERVILPTYFKDFLHMWHSKLGYITGSMSGNISKAYDIWQNKDFYGYEIHDEHAPFLEKRKDDLLYFLPKPFSFTSAAKMIDKGEPAAKVAMSFIGLNKAPGYLTHSDIENQIFDLYNIRNTSLKPKAEKEANDAKKEIRELYKTDKQGAEDKANEYVKKGLLRPSQVKFLFHNIGHAEDPSVFFFKELPFEDKKYLFEKMTGEEKKTYDPRGTFTRQLQSVKQAN